MNPTDSDGAAPATLGEIASHRARLHPERIAFVFDDGTTTYAELDRLSKDIAADFRHRGVGNGSRVAYLGRNSDLYFSMLFGAAKLGAVIVPVNWRLSPGETEYIVRQSHSSAIVADRGSMRMASAIAAKLGLAAPLDIAGLGSEAGQVPGDFGTVAVSPDEIVLQIYTSGTTGFPKGAMLSGRSLIGRVPEPDDPEWDQLTGDDVTLVAMPIGHVSGTGLGIRAVCAGATAVILREFHAERALEAMSRYRVTRVGLVPAALQTIVQSPLIGQSDLRSLKYIQYGGAPIHLELLRQCLAVVDCQFIQGYGTTEAGGTVAFLAPHDHTVAGNPRMKSVGQARPGVELAVVDDNGQALPAGSIGEIAVRSVATMTGYFDDPEATAQVLSADGWLRTGDAGRLDADGYLYLEDRIKDMIISGGENVYPTEVENAISAHRDVAEVAVIGVPDARWGEAVLAVVVPVAGSDPLAEDIIAFVRQRIAAYKTPKAVVFAGSLPRNPAGKILRRTLREIHAGDQTGGGVAEEGSSQARSE